MLNHEEEDFPIARWNTILSSFTDSDILRRTLAIAHGERECCGWLVAHLAEVDRRDLALQSGYNSLFKYARHQLRLSDSKAIERVAAARLSRHFPETPQKIASGELTLDSAADLWRAFQEEERRVRPSVIRAEAKAREKSIAPHFPFAAPTTPVALTTPTIDEMRGLFEQALGKTRNETQAAIESWKWKRSGETAPQKPRTTFVTLSLSDEDELAWSRIRDLLSHRLGSRSPEAALRWLIDQGLEKLDSVRVQARQDARIAKRTPAIAPVDGDALVRTETATSAKTTVPLHSEDDTLNHCEKASFLQKYAGSPSTSPSDRAHIPAASKRRVWIRCEGQCGYVDPTTGRVCGSTAFLDVDHVIPLSSGGPNDESNLRLACASHNRRRQNWEPAHSAST
jgi:hypothetical protein